MSMLASTKAQFTLIKYKKNRPYLLIFCTQVTTIFKTSTYLHTVRFLKDNQSHVCSVG